MRAITTALCLATVTACAAAPEGVAPSPSTSVALNSSWENTLCPQFSYGPNAPGTLQTPILIPNGSELNCQMQTLNLMTTQLADAQATRQFFATGYAPHPETASGQTAASSNKGRQ